MNYNSIQFLIFLPVVFLIYYILPSQLKMCWILMSNIFFYLCWDVRFLPVLCFLIAITYITGRLIEGCKTRKTKKIFLWICCISCVLLLFFLKYFEWFTSYIVNIFEEYNIILNIPKMNVIVPVGISFYLLQALGYVIDVYRGKYACEKSVVKYAVFISFFPQIISGPISRGDFLLPQICARHEFKLDNLKKGLVYILYGFSLKIIIADRIGIIVNQVFDNYSQYSGGILLIAVIMFAFQLYCDFDGYTNISVGVAKLLDIDLPVNFINPYGADSIKNFWKRWHISLSEWLRDYIYISLGGNKNGKIRKNVNLIITFLVSGLWHGVGLTYIIWGLLHAFYQIIGGYTCSIRNKIQIKIRVPRIVKIMITFALVDFAWIYFRADTVSIANEIIYKIVHNFQIQDFSGVVLYSLGWGRLQWVGIIMDIILLCIVSRMIEKKGNLYNLFIYQKRWVRWISAYTLILYIIIVLVQSMGLDVSEFIYGKF